MSMHNNSSNNRNTNPIINSIMNENAIMEEAIYERIYGNLENILADRIISKFNQIKRNECVPVDESDYNDLLAYTVASEMASRLNRF